MALHRVGPVEDAHAEPHGTVPQHGAPDAAQVGQLQTESCDAAWADRIDTLDTPALCAEFLAHEARVLPAIAAALPTIAALVDALTLRVQAGGRVFYVGAGNSGRVAYMDSSELPATFSAEPAQFQAVVAGGNRAVLHAREDAEDAEADGAAALTNRQLTPRDAVLGVSASGRTPFVLGALHAARRAGALTAGITSCQPSGFGRLGVQFLVTALTGAEFVAGSTRLKAGTAAKVVLNLVSTCTMVRLGKTYRGLMLDVRVRNNKLRVRGRRILRLVCASTGTAETAYLLGPADGAAVPRKTDLSRSTLETDAAIDTHIQCCSGSVKLACAVAVSALDKAMAQAYLDRVQGHFHRFLALLSPAPTPPAEANGNDSGLVLTIDGGGTTCKVAVATPDGETAHAEAGACNINCVTIDELVAQIRAATLVALERLRARRATATTAATRDSSGLQSVCAPARDLPPFARVWAGIAGLHYAFNPDALAVRLEALLGVSARDGSLRLTSDSMLLGACVGVDDSVQGGLAVIAGTGSVAVAFRKRASDGASVVPVSRAGGWGHLLGDHGSAFDIGRRALQAVLTAMELRSFAADEDEGEDDRDAGSGGDSGPGCDSEPSQDGTHDRMTAADPLEEAVLAALGTDRPADLLPRMLHDADQAPKQQIAAVARAVTAVAFAGQADSSSGRAQARAIVKDAVASLVARIKPLACSRLCWPGADVLILSGALFNLPPYRALFLDAWAHAGLPQFAKMVVVQRATDCATALLLKEVEERGPIRRDVGNVGNV